jgi:MFS family permease
MGIALFVSASLLCAVAPSPLFLIACRAVQGLGAAFMVPGSLALIAKAYPREERGRAIGIWATAASLTTILGPIVGGALLTALGPWSWRLVFAINLPFGLLALALLWTRVPPDAPADGRRLDWIGGLLITAALLLIALGLTGGAGDASVPGAT